MDADDLKAEGLDQGIQESAEVFDFLDAYFEDLEAGEVHPLGHYLERYPGREESISREFLAQQALRGGAAGPPAQAPTGIALEDESQVGPYRLLSEVGRGGQGVVYLAEDTRIARRVALKVLPPVAAFLSQDSRRRLQREAEVISRLAHPGICGIFDAEVGRELAYIAMPFVEGRTLASLITAERDSSRGERELAVPVGPKTDAQLNRLLSLFEEAARALHSAHEAGVVHRDIKPANLMVTPEGKPIWLDFGQARDAESQIADLTLSGEIFGTPAYMSPEQVAGRASDERTDVWALGISLFEALTLRRPFEAASAHALLLAVQNDEPLDARELNPVIGEELAVVIETALERDVTRRYASALALAEDLGRILHREPIRARPAGRLLRVRRWVQRHPVLSVLILTISVSLAVTSYLLLEQVRLLEEQKRITEKKDENLSWAVGRHLAERSEALIAENPASALILGIEAVERAPNYLTRSALFGALEACQLRMIYEAKDEPEQQNRFSNVALAPFSEQVVALRYDGEVRVFALESGERVGGWKAHPTPENSQLAAGLAIAAGRELVATAGSDGQIVVHELEGGQHVLSIRSVGEPVNRMWFGADDRALAVRSAAGMVDLYRLPDGERLAEFDPPPRGELKLDVERGTFFEELDWEQLSRGARQWDSITGAPGPKRRLSRDFPRYRFRGREFTFVRQSDDERFVFCVEPRGGVPTPKLIDLETRGELRLPLPVEVQPLAARFSPGGDRLAVIDSDGALRLWESSSANLIAEGRGYVHPQTLEWSQDGRYVLTGRRSDTLARLWYGTERPDLYRLRADDGPVRRVEFSPDGEYALTHSENGSLILWNTPSAPVRPAQVGTRRRDLSGPGTLVSGAVFDPRGGRLLSWTDGFPAWVELEGDSPPVRLAAWGEILSAEIDPMGTTILLGRAVLVESPDGGPGSWGLKLHLVADDGKPLYSLNDGSDPVEAGHFAPDGSCVVAYDAAGGLHCWDSESGLERWRLERADAEESPAEDEAIPQVVDVAFDPRGEVLAVAGDDLRVRFLSTKTGRVAREDLAVFPPESIEWSSDGRRLLITGAQGRGAVRVEDLEPPDPQYRVLRAEFFHADDLTGGAFSPDGQLALTTSLDGTIMVRDVSGAEDARSMILLAHLRGGGGAVLDADFSGGDGPLRVLAGLEDGTARVWPVDPLPSARARQPREELQDWELAREQRLARPLEYP